jgi:hypothetical protein
MKFEIIYEIKGTRKDIAIVPDSVELPDNWARYTLSQRDEWIYENQTSHEVIFEDNHFAEVVDIEWAD